MRWIGAIILLVGMTAIGFEWARRLSQRSKQIRELTTALQHFEAEVMYGHTPLIHVANRISSTVSSPLSQFFKDFGTRLKEGNHDVQSAWQESIAINWDKTAMKIKEKEALLQFGQTLGQHGRYEQQKYIQLTLTHLRAEEINAREEQLRYERMAKSLGFLGGLLAIIVMI
ncbi:stage III sporulation protein SpoIIIAB [Geomicrobium sediminis]|uniref:Stage III sporulation protein AB n=1 Tax=Geomicrobium sediminis TaxID=1347788 RepID=A0ABS2PEG9_9BACL|nr:stage III sporulation protein AB [Geomicrobium sediminis]